MKIRVLLCDDHAVVRTGLAAILAYEDDIEVVGQAADGHASVVQAGELRPDVVLMDLMMPKLDGTDATAELLRVVPDTKVLILTSYSMPDDVRRAIGAGAVGALLKTASNEEIVQAIRTAARGERVLSTEFRRSLSAPAQPAPELTPRQREILQSLTRGLTNKEIALQFGISVYGVKRHVEALFVKLGVSTRSEAVAIALRDQLLKF